MKFTVREGFVVHQTKLVEVIINGETTRQPQTNSYYGGQTVDFDESDALDHLHKLEAADKAAAAFVASRTRTADAAPAAPVVTADAIQALIDAAVAKALATAGSAGAGAGA